MSYLMAGQLSELERLRPRLLDVLAEDALDRLLEAAKSQLAAPGCWGMTFTLVQAWGRTPGATGDTAVSG
ncbi:MAG: hypothetical protein JWO59_2452 [Chloroflexi bacterium]|nr:hypothetical protein [Chloroflexota bacterium]MDB5074892.1 hypothetical protein [Chloroflexota bacterium]